MTLLPLSTFIFSLLAGSHDMGQPSSDVRGELVSRYKSVIEEADQEAEETAEADEEMS
ncbi:MAG: hypothetical protein H7A38_01050 [Chlamydiales bacterium]|nr:hypothetical protein [Chlamydiales bacterium]